MISTLHPAKMRLIIAALMCSMSADGSIAQPPAHHPLSDPENRGDWELNTEVSDEFDGSVVNEDRWFIVGKFEKGRPVYKHPDFPRKKVWKGRAPSQFSGRNYRLEDGMLKLEVRWEPDFPFHDEVHVPVFGDPLPYENITTACFIGRRSFKYGYIEIRSKAADAEVTSAFWSMGKQIEFDFFEQFGDGRNQGKEHLDSELWWSIRDWKHLKGKPSYTERKDLGFRVAEDFHVYGVEWDEQGVKYYVDGKLFSSVTADEVRAWAKENREVGEHYDGWVANRPIHLWLDMETFPWQGIPDSKADLELNSPTGKKNDGIVDFEIDYVRVWQKPGADNSPIDSDDESLFGFEGPAWIQGESMDWWIAEDSRKSFSISSEKAAGGNRSLKFTHSDPFDAKVTAYAPNGSMTLEPGTFDFTMKVWLEPNCSVNTLRVIFQEPWLELRPFDLTGLETGKWVTLTQSFRRAEGSGAEDRPRIVVQPDDVSGGTGTLFIDEISFEKKS